MHASRLRPLVALTLCATLSTPALADDANGDDLMTGHQVFTDVCASCHAGGIAGAPRYGDESTWQALLDEGQEVLTAHGWVGVRGMPPKGGKPDLKLEEFARAVAYMARSGGADWQDPDTAMLGRIETEVEKRIAALKAKAGE